jgi:hypothetical protein
MAVTSYTFVRKSKLAVFKELMINHSGLITELRDQVGSTDLVSVTYRFEEMVNYNSFTRDWQRVNTPINEVATPWYKKTFRKVKGRLLGALR